jgi:hypothetical protein
LRRPTGLFRSLEGLIEDAAIASEGLIGKSWRFMARAKSTFRSGRTENFRDWCKVCGSVCTAEIQHHVPLRVSEKEPSITVMSERKSRREFMIRHRQPKGTEFSLLLAVRA